MPSPEIERIRTRLAPLRSALLDHPLYAGIDGLPALRRFMGHHVFAVWDFMSLLKALQGRLCCVGVPWLPPADPAACRLVNEIVLGEESDEDGRGGHASHFTLYLDAMRGCGADTSRIGRALEQIRAGRSVAEALEETGAPGAVRRFVGQTFDVIESGDVPAIASAFAFGREDLLPDVFRRIVGELDAASEEGLKAFRYYLDRHIALDGGEHGPMAERLVADLCGDDPARWRSAESAAVRSLEARLALWDAVHDGF